jgi:hypothetical protein
MTEAFLAGSSAANENDADALNSRGKSSGCAFISMTCSEKNSNTMVHEVK